MYHCLLNNENVIEYAISSSDLAWFMLDGKYVDKFINRKDKEKLSRKDVFVCEKHF